MIRFLLLATFSMPAIPALAAPFLVAHRGASGEAPENTLPAFELAWKQGADAIEGDFHITGDGEIVCFHDFDTGKITGRKLVIKDTAFELLRSLDVGKWKDRRFAGTRVPTFLQVAAAVPEGKKFYIEIKCGPEIVPTLLSEIEESNLRREQIVVISFHPDVIKEVKRRRPQWIANWLYSFDQKKPDAPTDKLPELLATLETIGADGLGSNAHPGIANAHLARLGAAGYHHHVWTVNDPATARRFLDLGTRSVTTDYPGKLRKELADQPAP